MDKFYGKLTRTIVCSFLLIAGAMLIAPESRAQVSSAVGAPPVSVELITQVLWDQTANTLGVGISSQNFTDPGGAFDTFDNRAADDFEVPGALGWNIKTVRSFGLYQSGTMGPVQSLNVVFFTDDSGLPGSVVQGCEYLNISAVNNADPNFIIDLPVPCTLTSGVYWVSVQVNMPFNPNGQWFWFTESVQTLNPYAWENPLNGTGNGCTTWTDGITCIPAGGIDLTYQLIGDVFLIPRPIPTLSQWALLATVGAMGVLGVFFVLRRGRRACS